MIDLALLVLVALVAVSGYRRGMITSAMVAVSFTVAAALAIAVLPAAVDAPLLNALPRPAVALAVLFFFASLAQVAAVLASRWLRARADSAQARRSDAAAGATASALAALIAVWSVAAALTAGPVSPLSEQVRASYVLSTIDALVPAAGKDLTVALTRAAVDTTVHGAVSNLSPSDVPAVAAPDPELVKSLTVVAVRPSVLKITGVAEQCRRRVEGTGFVFAPDRLMTNAHVLSGVSEPQVEVHGKQVAARTVLFDAGRDIAVLHVPGLGRKPLEFAGPAAASSDALVIGYPEDGPFTVEAARVRGIQKARGPDIHQSTIVIREIYSLRGKVRPGNSGGPLFDLNGRVLGVIFAAAAEDPDTGYAVTAREVQTLVGKAATATAAVDTGSCS